MLFLAALLCAACTSSHQPSRQRVSASLEAMHEAVASEITDGQRASQLNQAINGLEAELLSFGTLFDRFQSAVRTLNARPDSTRVEFEALCEKFEAQRIAARTRVAQFHFEMIAATTPAEWHELASHESAALTATER